MSLRLEKYLERLESLGMSIMYRPGVYEIIGGDTETRRNAREYLCRHDDLMSEISILAGGEKYTPSIWRGNIETLHEHEVWSIVVCPLDIEEVQIQDYWRNYAALRYMYDLADDFHSCWEEVTKGEDIAVFMMPQEVPDWGKLYEAANVWNEDRCKRKTH